MFPTKKARLLFVKKNFTQDKRKAFVQDKNKLRTI